ncbi:reticulon-1-A-like isoform X4 [Scleropages formosus]|uniref:reticulon-1-A-like isoform X4 n=1 Tax=Scleropages formosus TaxID=113540 RepID=UPI000878F833|nr:reticulon-4 isoform X4 [Scleropages formosus]
MEDNAEISSTTPHVGEHQLGEDRRVAEPSSDFAPASRFEDREALSKYEEDILDLAGGAQEAIERHRQSDTPVSHDFSAFDSSGQVEEPEEDTLMNAGRGFGDSLGGRTPTEGFGEAVSSEPETSPPGPASTGKEPRSASPPPNEPIFPPSAPSQPLMHSSAVVDLLYWRDVKTTGVVFGAALFLLLSLTVCSIISVCSYVALALLSVTITFRIYKGILQAVQKSDEGHPFKVYLEQDVALSEDLVHKYSDVTLVHINSILKELRRLFLVEDLVDSLKFAVLMWILTYVGALFNGLTLLILGLIAVFSCPVIYERHQKQIDHYLALARNQMKDVVGKIQAKIPGMKPKTE